MSVYKPFTTSDIVVTPFKVNKSFSFQGTSSLTALNVGIDRFRGINHPITNYWISGSNSTGDIARYNERLVYDSIKQLYYSNYLRGKDGSTVNTASFNVDGTITAGGGPNQPMYENYLSNTLDANRVFPTGSGEEDGYVGVMSIPSKLFGEYIKPGTFRWKLGDIASLDITDDGEGALIAGSGASKVGDIIYQQGMAILTDFAESRKDSMIDNEPITCSFESTMTIYESQYKCTFLANEFNYTQNPSAISSSSNSGTVYDFLTGSYFQPYITTVGLYNNANELVAVGKLAQPLQSSNTTDTTILVNLDL